MAPAIQAMVIGKKSLFDRQLGQQTKAIMLWA